MNKRNLAFGVLILCSVALVGTVLGTTFAAPSVMPASANGDYTLTVNSYEGVVNGTRTKKNNLIQFSRSGVTSLGGKIKLSQGGFIQNSTKVSGIERIDVTLSSGSVNLSYGLNGTSSWSDAAPGPTLLTEGIYPNYFKITATEDSVIDKFVVTYACVDYQQAASSTGFSLYVNGVKSDSPFIEVDKEGHDLQLKATLDVYPGDVLTFDYNGSEIKPSAGFDGNNAYYESSGGGYLMVSNYAKGADLYLKRDNGNYDVWLTGKGGSMERSPYDHPAILQAFNWSIPTINYYLDEIADAGYTAIQVSPMQTRKYVYRDTASWNDEWWKLYQPDGFTVAQERVTSGSGATFDGGIGIASDLSALCAAAKAKGIAIIMDVVLNHLSGGDATHFGGNVSESGIVSGNLKHNYGEINNWNSQEQLVRYSPGGYPDLMTEDPYVQSRALSLLKDYADLGVSGFRFDAAKHIETPKDGYYASKFWPYVINGLRRYNAIKGYDAPYLYGEILNPEDGGRSGSWYTDYMDVASGYRQSDMINGVSSSNMSLATNEYYCSIPKHQRVLWAESHDTYVDAYKKSTVTDPWIINKGYAMFTSLADTSTLYCARPKDGNQSFGMAGDSSWASTTWKNPAVSAINKLHTASRAVGESIDKTSTLNTFVNSRGETSDAGSVAIKFNGSNSYEVYFPKIWNGSYKDLATGNIYNVDGGRTTINFGSQDVAVLMPTASSTYYLTGNSIFGASWSKESGVQMTPSGSYLAEISPRRIEAGAEVKIIRAIEGQADQWLPVNVVNMPDYCGITEPDGNLIFNKGGVYSVKLSSDFKYVITGTPDPDPEQSSEESSSSEQSSSSSSSSTSSSSSSAPASLTSVYFSNGQKWGEVMVYMWKGTTKNAAWPGVAPTWVGKNDYNEDIYRIDNIDQYDYLIVNNNDNGKQTVDIAISNFTAQNNAFWLDGTKDTQGHYKVGGYWHQD